MRAGIRMRCETDPDKCQGLLGPRSQSLHRLLLGWPGVLNLLR
jgi:hypothetical protein